MKTLFQFFGALGIGILIVAFMVAFVLGWGLVLYQAISPYAWWYLAGCALVSGAFLTSLARMVLRARLRIVESEETK